MRKWTFFLLTPAFAAGCEITAGFTYENKLTETESLKANVQLIKKEVQVAQAKTTKAG